MPELDSSNTGLPYGSVDLSDGYTLLRKRSKHSVTLCSGEAIAISQFLGPGHIVPCIKKWAQLCLPNGQIARSAWRESLRPAEQICMSRNVKFLCNGETCCGEVRYFTRLVTAAADDNWEFVDVAVIHMYSAPDEDLLRLLNHVVLASHLLNAISVIKVKQIVRVIAMIPRQMVLPRGVEGEFYCMMERPGYDISSWGVPYGVYADVEDDDNGKDVE
ncbi:hypothetical protein PISMIDRAFT_13954 [Pisolithus microcarpus 441]|uniref:Uncharacterized protein n=1 Tax=Pisolithus microcarpus 441 TaxID=765257 RepID=A0A0C9ZGH5_9AGAM|nr:hypothetical protein PISMIDRAFT_13954 [Pisolithus microcarpus 441]